MKITGKTNIYGIIGCPIQHSLSPVFQAYFAQKHQLDSVYVPYHVEAADLERAILGLAALGVKGVNVTVPYKEAVLPYVIADDDVQRIGATNTLHWCENMCYASNTDWQGVAAVLQGTDLDLAHTSILLFGAGGTARAVVHAANQLGIEKVYICNRSAERLARLLEHIAKHYPDLKTEAVAWQQPAVNQACQACEMLMNTTSIGLAEGQEFPFQLSGQGWAMDAVYKVSGQTAFTMAAIKSARQALDGLPMLVAQGAQSLMLWQPTLQVNSRDALLWMEQRLGRSQVNLPGWMERS